MSLITVFPEHRRSNVCNALTDDQELRSQQLQPGVKTSQGRFTILEAPGSKDTQ